MIHQLKSVQEFQYLMSEVPYQLIVLDFTASWCGPCHRIAPYFEKLSHENPNVIFYRIDIDEYPEIATQFKKPDSQKSFIKSGDIAAFIVNMILY